MEGFLPLGEDIALVAASRGIQSTKLLWVGKEEQSWAQRVIEESLMRCLLFEIDIICQMNLNDHISF